MQAEAGHAAVGPHSSDVSVHSSRGQDSHPLLLPELVTALAAHGTLAGAATATAAGADFALVTMPGLRSVRTPCASATGELLAPPPDAQPAGRPSEVTPDISGRSSADFGVHHSAAGGVHHSVAGGVQGAASGSAAVAVGVARRKGGLKTTTGALDSMK